MGDLIDLQVKREEKNPTIAGEAICSVCKHEWTAVAPVGTIWLECPSCHTIKGLFKYSCKKEEEPRLVCECDNDVFVVYRTGILCTNCGKFRYKEEFYD